MLLANFNASVPQVVVERALRNVQILGDGVHTQTALAVKRFCGHAVTSAFAGSPLGRPRVQITVHADSVLVPVARGDLIAGQSALINLSG